MCRYTVQNAKALSEAKIALATGEIKTPSQCSKWSSESERSDGALERKTSACSSTEASSGEEYKISRSDDSSRNGSERSDSENSEQPDTSISRNSVDEEEEFCTSTETSNSEGSWEAEDRSTIAASDTDKSLEVYPKH